MPKSSDTEWSMAAQDAVYLFYVFYSWFRALLSLFIANSSGQINVPCLEDALVEVVVKSASAYRYLIGMHSKYMT